LEDILEQVDAKRNGIGGRQRHTVTGRESAQGKKDHSPGKEGRCLPTDREQNEIWGSSKKECSIPVGWARREVVEHGAQRKESALNRIGERLAANPGDRKNVGKQTFWVNAPRRRNERGRGEFVTGG